MKKSSGTVSARNRLRAATEKPFVFKGFSARRSAAKRSVSRLQGFFITLLGVRTAVILTHDRSRLGKINASVDAVATLSDLKPQHLVPTPSAELSDHEVDEVVTLIAEDHRFHEERRRQGSRRRGKRAKSPSN